MTCIWPITRESEKQISSCSRLREEAFLMEAGNDRSGKHPPFNANNATVLLLDCRTSLSFKEVVPTWWWRGTEVTQGQLDTGTTFHNGYELVISTDYTSSKSETQKFFFLTAVLRDLSVIWSKNVPLSGETWNNISAIADKNKSNSKPLTGNEQTAAFSNVFTK